MMDRTDYITAVHMLHDGFGEIAVTIEDQIAEGDRVTTRWSAVARHTGSFAGIAPTGREVMLAGHRHPPPRRRSLRRGVGADRLREPDRAAHLSARSSRASLRCAPGFKRPTSAVGRVATAVAFLVGQARDRVQELRDGEPVADELGFDAGRGEVQRGRTVRRVPERGDEAPGHGVAGAACTFAHARTGLRLRLRLRRLVRTLRRESGLGEKAARRP